jgi:hypothetical protein
LQFVVRTFDPAGDRAFSHVFREGALLSGLREEGKSLASGGRYSRVSRMLNTARKLITPATAM